MPSLLENLNPEQLAAVTLPDQSALILAGAGSGKTRVLTTRIAWLIQTGNVSPNGVLAVTFTNKAAREMLTRISAMLPISTRGMWVGTFHGLCNRLLRAHYRDAGLPQLFQILDSQDQHAAVKRVLKALSVDEDRFPARDTQYFINAAKEEGRRARDLEIGDEITRRYAEIYAAYDEQCQREGVVDFAELLLRTFELLSRNEILREHYRNRFRHILVDEFQDTNRLQYRWLKLLAGPKNIVFAVGDDDQSIYRFRGAHVGNMAEFERDFRVENIIRLERNYRSHAHILAAANALIAHNRKRLGKNLWTSAAHGEPVRIYEEASGLCRKSGAARAAFLRLLESIKAETQGLPLPETVEIMLQKSGLVAHYKAERDGADRVENLNELVNAAAAFVNEGEEHDLPAFLAHAALESGENQAAEGTDALQLMTVHSAKGLEFHAAFITGLEEGLFPHEQSVLEEDGLEEERRLMYVAITRARTRLYLSFAQTRSLHGQTPYNVAS